MYDFSIYGMGGFYEIVLFSVNSKNGRKHYIGTANPKFLSKNDIFEYDEHHKFAVDYEEWRKKPSFLLNLGESVTGWLNGATVSEL